MKNNIRSIILLLIIFVFIGSLASVEAHRMLIKEFDGTQVVVEFEDGSQVGEVDVIFYNDDEEVIEEGITDENGRYKYKSETEPVQIVAEDEFGHRAVWTADEEPDGLGNIPRALRMVLGVVLILVAGGLVHLKFN